MRPCISFEFTNRTYFNCGSSNFKSRGEEHDELQYDIECATKADSQLSESSDKIRRHEMGGLHYIITLLD